MSSIPICKRFYLGLLGLLGVLISPCLANWQLVFKNGTIAEITEYKIEGDQIRVKNTVGAEFKFAIADIDTARTEALNKTPIFKPPGPSEPAQPAPTPDPKPVESGSRSIPPPQSPAGTPRSESEGVDVADFAVELKFHFGKDFLASGERLPVFTAILRYVRPFQTMEEAARFGNTASGVHVAEISSGMTFAQVESRLGLPEKKFTIGGKVVYKYKDVTVEFLEGKVSDVKY